MPFLMHQNMRVFGGGNAGRNAAYLAAFPTIINNAGIAAPVAVAGFTEIVNNGAATAALGGGGVNLCAALGVNLYAVVACGQTALANGPEFVGIGVHRALNVLSVGRILLQANGGNINLIHDVAPALPPGAGWAGNVPAQATLDYRGLVYVVVQDAAAGVYFAVGFLHNLYTFVDQRTLVMGRIPGMMGLMAENPALAHVPAATFYIGGDFNVNPMNRGTTRTGIAYAYAQGALNLTPPALAAGVPAGVGTTSGGNLYDYWYCSINPTAPAGVPIPAADGTTMDSGPGWPGAMSDHAASVLQIF